MTILLYRRPGCPLCDDAEALLDELGVAFLRANILEDERTFVRYRYRIPVLDIDGAEVLELRFDMMQLQAALAAAGVTTK